MRPLRISFIGMAGTSFISSNTRLGTNVVYLARVEWDLEGFEFDLKDFPKWFAPIAQEFSIRWRITRSNYRPRVAILFSKYDHCLVDMLYRQRIGELSSKSP